MGLRVMGERILLCTGLLVVLAGCGGGSGKEAEPQSPEVAFLRAVERGDLAAATAALDAGVDVNARLPETKENALYFAVFNDSPKMVEFLLSRGADINAKAGLNDDTPLHTAIYRGWNRTAELLIEKGADLEATNRPGKAPLQLALSLAKWRKHDDHRQLIALLKEHGKE